MISLVIYGSRDAMPAITEIDRAFRSWHSPPERSAESWGSEYEWWRDEIGEVLCGMARGADLCGKAWAEARGIPVVEMPAEWETWPASDPLGRGGKLKDKRAGHKRNRKMAERATHGLGFWRGESGGTANMSTHLAVLGKPNKVAEWKP